MMKKHIATLAFCATAWIATAQNQFHISEYMLHQPFVNPSAIGSYNNVNGALFYKNQWSGIDGAPQFGGIDINTPIGNGPNSVGLSIVYDKLGVSQNTDINARYAYNIKTSDKSHLVFGLGASLRMIQNNYSQLAEVGNDPSFNNNTPTIMLPNFKFGTYFYTNKFYVGFAIPNILKNTVSASGGSFSGNAEFDFNDMHMYLHSGAEFELSETLDLNPSIMIKNASGAPLQFDINSHLVFKKKVGIGISYRTSKELIGLLNYQITNSWKLGYAFDFGFSDLGRYSSGSHEIMLLLNIQQQKQQALIQAPRY